MQLTLDYYYNNESEQFSFYRIPKVLFTDERYRAVSLEARTLYGLLLDRMSLSTRNGWLDGDGKVFIYFTQEDVQEYLGCGHNKATAFMRELEAIGLIERKKQGQGKPAKIYVKNFVSASDKSQDQAVKPAPREAVQTAQNGQSKQPEKGGQDCPKGATNNTEKKKTERSDTDLSSPSSPPPARKSRQRRKVQADEMDSIREIIRENIDYEGLVWDHPTDSDLFDGYVELMVQAACSARETIRICGEEIPTTVVRSRFLKLGREHITYVRDCLCNSTAAIGNIKAYTLAALYNAPVTMGQYYAALASRDIAAEHT